MLRQGYADRVRVLTKEELAILEKNFYKLRDKFLLYKAAGRSTKNATECALFDTFEGDEDYSEFKFNDERIIHFCTMILVFDSISQFNEYMEEAKHLK